MTWLLLAIGLGWLLCRRRDLTRKAIEMEVCDDCGAAYGALGEVALCLFCKDAHARKAS